MMNTSPNSTRFSNAIRAFAQQAARADLSPAARQIARCRGECPVDYMRYAEFDAILRELDLAPNMTVLDVSSPQWFSLFLASQYPGVQFQYINLVAAELEPYREIAQALGLANISHRIGDARALDCEAGAFDCVISISVIEHIYPAEGGDVTALREVARVLKPGGAFLMTVPYKAQGGIVYVDGPVYERTERTKNFFAREYDAASFANLLTQTELTLAAQWFICERPGLLAVDYYEWGPGRNTAFAKLTIRSRKLIQRLFSITLDERLARQYLTVSKDIAARVVNIAARFKKA